MEGSVAALSHYRVWGAQPLRAPHAFQYQEAEGRAI
jgi:hypothetical protein